MAPTIRDPESNSCPCPADRTAAERVAAPVRRVADVYLRSGAGPLRARGYSPDVTGPSLLLFLHGDIECADRFCRELCSHAGVTVLSAVCGGVVRDATRVLGWVADHAAELGADPGRLLVSGAGSGGNLAAGAALHARDHQWPAITRQILIYPDLDAGPLPDPYAARLSAPSLAGVAPATVVTVENHPIQDDGRRYAPRLRQAGVRVDELRHDDRACGVRSLFGALRDRADRGTDE
jgi:acetyl esterase